MKTSYRRRYSRTARLQRGTATVLIVCMLMMIALLTNALLTWQKLSLSQNNSATVGDSLALQAAVKLNELDQTGRMNNLTAQSRAGVYLSRQQFEKVQDPRFFSLEPLARHLLEDARYGAQLVDYNRQQLAASRIDELQQLVLGDDHLLSGQMEIAALEVGELTDATSNAANNDLEQPQDFDIAQKYVDRKTKLFSADVNARLPGEDNDLNFMFSPLSPPLRNSAISAALLRSDHFLPRETIVQDGERSESGVTPYVPSALRIKLISKTGLEDASAARVSTCSLACTNGAQPMP